MTEYIKNQLIKLCDHPEWFNDMLTIWDNNPEKPHMAIRNYLSHIPCTTKWLIRKHQNSTCIIQWR